MDRPLTDEQPNGLRLWRREYGVVLVNLVLMIVFLWLFTKAFQ